MTEPALQVDRLHPGDEQRLRAIRLRALAEDPDAFYRTLAEEQDHPVAHWQAMLAAPRGAVVVARPADGTDVGLSALVPDRKDPDGLAVVAVWVDEPARGLGAARRMMDHLIGVARAQGAAAVTVEVADANAAAVHLYERTGFARTGETGAFAPPREHVTEHKRRLVLEVVGERVRLVPPTRDQLRDLLGGHVPAPFAAAEGWPHADTLDAVRPAAAAPVPWTWWVVVDGRVVGDCGLLGPPRLGAAEIGYGLAEPSRGVGLGTEVVALLRRTLVDDVGLTRLSAVVERRFNEVSRKVLERNGFQGDEGRGSYVLDVGPAVREVVASDLPRVRDVYAAGVRSRAATFRPDEPTLDEIRDRWRSRWDQHPWLVVEDEDGVVLGWAAAQPYGARPAYDGVADLAVYLDPAAPGRGLGRALLTALARAGAERGLHKLTSRVLTTNRGSRALMRSVGFREVGVHERHGRIDGSWHDVVVVELLLDA